MDRDIEPRILSDEESEELTEQEITESELWYETLKSERDEN